MRAPECRLYLITPPSIADVGTFAVILDDVLAAGDVAALQVRLKPASDEAIRTAVCAILPVARKHDVALILNDRPDLAAELGCDGVHVGQSDTSVAAARRLMGRNAMVGATCHDSRHLAMEAAEAGADYVAFGAFFATDTKQTEHQPAPDILSIWQELMETPCVAIGGITLANAEIVIEAGADFIAVSGGVWNHPDGPVVAVQQFDALLSRKG